MSVSLSSLRLGDGPPLVILHGLFGHKRNWGRIAKSLAETHSVHCLDLRNHGDSPWDDVMTYDAMAADVALYLRKLGEGPVTLIGHSMGGKTAMTVALHNAALLEQLIVVDMAPAVSQGETFARYINAMKAMPVAEFKSRKDADQTLAETIPEMGIRAFLLQNLEPLGSGGFRWKPNLSTLGAQLEDIYDFPAGALDHAFEKPTLFLAGGKSNYVGPQHTSEMNRLFPNHDLEVMADAGHWLHAEQPAAFIEAVRRRL